MTDFKRLHLLAQAASASYLITGNEQKEAVEKLGLTYVASVGSINDDAQAIVAQWDGRRVVAFSGTRFSEGPVDGRIKEDFDNLNLFPMEWGSGHAAAGYADRLLKIYPAIWEMTKDSDSFLLTGHSAGACQAFLFAAKLPATSVVEVIGFAGPKCGGPRLWLDQKALGRTFIQVARDGDVFFDYGWPWTHPSEEFVRLPDGVTATRRPGIDCSISAHSIDLYVKDLEVLAMS